MKKFKTVVYPPRKDYDHADVKWESPDGSIQGFGYIEKKSSLIRVMKCPNCHNENYMKQPVCISCGFNPNPEGKK